VTSNLVDSLGLPRFPYNISATAEVRNSKIGTLLGFTKAHHKILHRRKCGRGRVLQELSKMLGFPFNICATAEVSNFKFGTQLGLAEAHHKNHNQRKSERGLGLWKLPNIWGSP